MVEVRAGAGLMAAMVSGVGPDLLALHGGPGLSNYMDLLDGELAGWRVIRYQQRGLAPSTADGPFTIAQHMADAIAVLDACDVQRAAVLGHSWGGHLALQLAIAHSDRVRAVVVIDGLGCTGDGGSPALGAELRARLSPEATALCEALDRRQNAPDATDEDALRSLQLLWPSYFADPATAPGFPDGLRLSIRVSAETMASVLDELRDGSFARRLQRLEVPVVVLVGQASPMPTSVGEQTAALAPRGELVVVPGAGHLPWYERPGCVADALRPFLAQTPSDADASAGFETARLVIREPCEDELERMLFVYQSNPGYLEMTEASGAEPGRYDPGMLQRDLAIAQMTPGRQLAVVVERDTAEIVGVLDWMRENPSDGRPWIGLAMTRADRQTQGFAREAVDGLIGVLRAQGHRVVRAGVISRNEAGMHLVRGLGFEHVANRSVRMVSEEDLLIFELVT